MQRSVSSLATSRFVFLLLLPGCLVSFNDYPLGETPHHLSDGGTGTSTGPTSNGATSNGATSGGGTASAGTSSAGSGAQDTGGSTAPTAGTDTGGSASSGGSAAAGGSSGGSTSGGTTDEAGSPDMGQAGSPMQLGNPNLIDDFEDNDADILEQQGRSGAWSASNDGRGTQTPKSDAALLPSVLDPARDGSLHGAHTFGGPFQSWGALIGTPFAVSGNTGVAYDASQFTGVRVWVRSGATSPYAAKSVRINFPTTETYPGGGCSPCNDHFGVGVPLTSKWVQIEVPFASLKQGGWGRPHLTTPDLKKIMGVQFLFPVNVTFDLWLDDIEFY